MALKFENLRYYGSDVTILFENLPSQASEIDHFEIFGRPQENQLARRLFL